MLMPEMLFRYSKSVAASDDPPPRPAWLGMFFVTLTQMLLSKPVSSCQSLAALSKVDLPFGHRCSSPVTSALKGPSEIETSRISQRLHVWKTEAIGWYPSGLLIPTARCQLTFAGALSSIVRAPSCAQLSFRSSPRLPADFPGWDG